jgi:hypothetical protein
MTEGLRVHVWYAGKEEDPSGVGREHKMVRVPYMQGKATLLLLLARIGKGK